jgi:ketosteroid isomerase-like protein
VELHDRAVDALDRRDLDAFLELMSADVEALPRQAAIEGVYAGHAGIHHWWGDLLGALPDFAVEVVELRDLGDWTLAALRFLGHGADSETPFEEAVWQVGEWRDGKSVWWSVYGSEAEALEAVGLRE